MTAAAAAADGVAVEVWQCTWSMRAGCQTCCSGRRGAEGEGEGAGEGNGYGGVYRSSWRCSGEGRGVCRSSWRCSSECSGFNGEDGYENSSEGLPWGGMAVDGAGTARRRVRP